MATQYGFGKIVTDGLVLALDAADRNSYVSGSTTWFDMSSNNITCSLTNSPTFSFDKGGSIIFDGINDYVILQRPPQLVTSGSITINMWTKWNTSGSSIQILLDNNHSSPPRQGFVIQDRPDLSNRPLSFTSNILEPGVTSSFTVGDGNWHNIAATNNGTSSLLYIDGVLNGSFLEGGLATVQPNISLGYGPGFGRYLKGSIADVYIYNRALSSQEVLQNFNAQKARFNL